MEVMFDRVAGLDVGKETLTVCVRTPGPGGGRRSETRTFKTTTGSSRVMRDWLVEAGVSIAAMESTSTYWKPPFYCLEEVMEVWARPGVPDTAERDHLVRACPYTSVPIRMSAHRGPGCARWCRARHEPRPVVVATAASGLGEVVPMWRPVAACRNSRPGRVQAASTLTLTNLDTIDTRPPRPSLWEI